MQFDPRVPAERFVFDTVMFFCREQPSLSALIRDLRPGMNPLVPHRPVMAGVPLLAARAIAQALWQSSGSSRNTQDTTVCEGGKRTMYSLQHSGSRRAFPGGNIRGKSSGRRRRAWPWQRPPGAPGALPAPEAAWARAWAPAAPPSGGARSWARERPRHGCGGPRAAPRFPGGRLFQAGP